MIKIDGKIKNYKMFGRFQDNFSKFYCDSDIGLTKIFDLQNMHRGLAAILDLLRKRILTG